MKEVWTVFLSILRPVNQPLMHYRNKMQKFVAFGNLCLRIVILSVDLVPDRARGFTCLSVSYFEHNFCLKK
jgi:hypothetical protein